nr:hypothetical protein KitaXyl93_34070 [Kitasatospora sp. Xyl93]
MVADAAKVAARRKNFAPAAPTPSTPLPGSGSKADQNKKPQVRGLTWGFTWSRLRDSNPRPTHYEFAQSLSVTVRARPHRWSVDYVARSRTVTDAVD